MIISTDIKIKIHNSTIKYYNNLGYKNIKNKDEIIIPVEYLPKGSNQIILVKCDICGKEKNIKYRLYNYSISKNNFYCCAGKCARSKIDKTNMEKYGCISPTQNDDILKKREQTYIEKYGYITNLMCKETKDKIKETTLKIYGVENVSQNEEIKKKKKETTFKNYGVENPLQSKEIQDKIKEMGVRMFDNSEGYKLYRNMVLNETNRNRKKLFENWNGYDFYDKEYIFENLKLNYKNSMYPSVDHKISIMYGFKNEISAEIIGGLDNLCITKRKINSIKNSKNFDIFIEIYNKL